MTVLLIKRDGYKSCSRIGGVSFVGLTIYASSEVQRLSVSTIGDANK